ncbi:MAG: histidine phosphatase family protein [Betaproteobacteria bacterium]|nr:histidine phosphatase family protein [Betaproteobacteria bacterium]
MDLILWRHADAFDGIPDMTRRLTPKGHKQAEAVARWLQSRLPKHTRILVSPATRARETVEALTNTFETVDAIAPGAQPESVLAASGWPEAPGAVLVVGHQPTLGLAVSLLLAGEPMPWSIRKGGIWWLTHRVRGEDAQVVVRAVVNPDLV